MIVHRVILDLLDAADQRLLQDVRDVGWHVIKIAADAATPGWAFSVGLGPTFNHPELVVFGLALDLMHTMINSAVLEIRHGITLQGGSRSSEILDGYACEWTKGKHTLYLVYEAYDSMALTEMQRLGVEAHKLFDIAHLGIVHRTGRLEIGETSVVIAASAPHRQAAFQACEWAIRELKRTVPIWKKEVFDDGETWVEDPRS